MFDYLILFHLLHLLDDVDRNHSDHELDGGQDGQDGHPDDLVVLQPVQKFVLTRILFHTTSGVLIILSEKVKLFESIKKISFAISLETRNLIETCN